MIAPKRIVLGRQDVHVWRAVLDVAADTRARLERLLSGDELQRAACFHRSQDRERFILARAFLRDALSAYVQTEPADLQFAVTPAGKPRLRGRGAGTPVQFNLSHSDAIALLAITADRPVGIDIERVRRDIEHDAIVRQFFSPTECREYFRLGDEERPSAFARLWTRKEAYLKALGEGMGKPLDSFAVPMAPGAAAESAAFLAEPDADGEWIVFGIDAPPGYEAALATRGQLPRLFSWTWQPDTPA